MNIFLYLIIQVETVSWEETRKEGRKEGRTPLFSSSSPAHSPSHEGQDPKVSFVVGSLWMALTRRVVVNIIIHGHLIGCLPLSNSIDLPFPHFRPFPCTSTPAIGGMAWPPGGGMSMMSAVAFATRHSKPVVRIATFPGMTARRCGVGATMPFTCTAS